MLVRWEGGTPPDRQDWSDVLSEVLGDESASYWVRFYQEPGGWRFDLERRSEAPGPDGSMYQRADQATALRVFASLVEKGKPLDPDWSPSAVRARALVPRTPPPDSRPAPLPLFEPAEAAPGSQSPTSPMGTEPVAALPAPSPQPQSLPVLTPVSGRFARWRRLRPVAVYAPAVLLVALAWWLSRGRVPAAPTPSPATTALTALGQVTPTGPEAPGGVGSPRAASARASAVRVPATSANTTLMQLGTSPGPTPAPGRRREGDAGARSATPAPAPPTTRAADLAPAELPSLADLSVGADTAAPIAPVLEPAPEVLSTPAPPPRRGELIDVNGPGLTPPVVVSQSRPAYPPLALERRISGTVWLNALVDETGAVLEVDLVRASPQGLDFEGAAIAHVRSRVYRPATKQGVPVRVRLPIKVEFHAPGQ